MLLMAAVTVTNAGYLISTADGKAIGIFDWFVVPATLTGIPEQADLMVGIHFWLAMLLLAVSSLHSLATLKHHFTDRDATLVHMFGR